MYLKVKRKDGESVRNKLISLELFDGKRKIISCENFLYIPVLEINNELPCELSEFETASDEYVKKLAGEVEIYSKHRDRSLLEACQGRIPDEKLNILPTSFDIIGDIAILELPDDLKEYEKIIGESLIKTFKNIRVAAKKTSTVDTEYRTRNYRVIAGDPRLKTTHREYGCLYSLDIEKAYFSPRLGNERKRITDLVQSGETVLVMFAGVGPYPIQIAKFSKPEKVYAVELNPDAVEYMRENIKINGVSVTVIPFCGSASETGKLMENFKSNFNNKKIEFDRIIMPLPKDAGSFLDTACALLKDGGIIHFYTFAKTTGEAEDYLLGEFETMEQRGKLKENSTIEIIKSVVCGSYSPSLHRICVDFVVHKRGLNK